MILAFSDTLYLRVRLQITRVGKYSIGADKERGGRDRRYINILTRHLSFDMIVPRSNICQHELFVVAPEGTAYQRMPGSQSVKVATFRRPQDCAVHNEHRVTISALRRTYEYCSTSELCLRGFEHCTICGSKKIRPFSSKATLSLTENGVSGSP